jgi:hypothetical protein
MVYYNSDNSDLEKSSSKLFMFAIYIILTKFLKIYNLHGRFLGCFFFLVFLQNGDDNNGQGFLKH